MSGADPADEALVAVSWTAAAASVALLAVSAFVLAVGCGPEASAAAPGAWRDDVGASTCPAGEWPVEARCVPAEQAFVGPGGRTWVVDRRHARASDDNPGTADRPLLTISAGASRARPGDAVLIRAGTYRESIRPRVGGTGPEARVTFAAYPGEAVVVSGADRADDGWHRARGGGWRRAWTGPGLPTYTDDPLFRREMVIAGGRVLRPVTDPSDLAPGRSLAEGPVEAPRALLVRFPGDAAPDAAGGVEVTVRERLFWPLGPDPYADCGDPGQPGWFRLVGLTFRHAANRAQWGALCAGREGGRVEDVRVEWTVGLGIDVRGRGHTFLRTRSDLNGQLGWGGGCHGCLFEETAAVGNNWRGHDPFWEAGGGKWVGTTDTVIRRHYAAHNGGPGIWLDMDNRRNTVEGSLVVGNEVAGIMLEYATTETLVQHNVVASTRWRAWSGSGLLSQAASENVFAHNTVVENEGTGLWLRLDPDRRAPDGRNVVVNNRIVGNATGDVEAREVSVEGTSSEHVRSNRFEANVYGRLGRGLYESTFFLAPAPQFSADFRSDDLEAWRRLVDGDRRARFDRPRRAVAPEPVPSTGASRSIRAPAAEVGADPARVRARGDWSNAPPPPEWPR